MRNILCLLQNLIYQTCVLIFFSMNGVAIAEDSSIPVSTVPVEKLDAKLTNVVSNSSEKSVENSQASEKVASEKTKSFSDKGNTVAEPTMSPEIIRRPNDSAFLLQEVARIDRLSNVNVEKITDEKSEKHADDGYIANPAAVDCFAAYSYQFTGGKYYEKEITFRLRSPLKIVKGRKYPLIVHFHGAGESNDDNTRQLAHLQSTLELLFGPQNIDCFILATHCPANNRNWSIPSTNDCKGDDPLTYTSEIIDIILKEYPIDQNCVSAFGICSGARGMWEMAERRPDLFCAMAGATIAISPKDVQERRSHTENIWFFHNDNDETAPLEPVYAAVKMLKSTGANVHLTVRQKAHDSWSDAMRTDKVYAWLAVQRKGSTLPPPGAIVAYHHSWVASFFKFILPAIIIVAMLTVRRKQLKIRY